MTDFHEVVAATMHGQEVSLHDLLYCLKIHEKTAWLTETVQTMVMMRAASRAGLTIQDAELQRAAEQFRRSRRLYKAADTFRWLQERQMTVRDLETRLEQELLTVKLREHVTTGQIERYFAEHKTAFDTARIAHIMVDKSGVAHELFSQLTEEDADFSTLARKYSLELSSRDAGGYVGLVRRKMLSPAAEALVFTAQAGAIVGPVKTEAGYQVIQVQEHLPSTLDDAIRAEITTSLFTDWLRAEMRQAQVALPLLQHV